MPVMSGKRDDPSVMLYGEQSAARPRNQRQLAQDLFGALPSQNFGLVIHSRVAILDVERIGRDNRACFLKSNSHKQAFGEAVSRTKSKIADAEENRPPVIDLKRLNDMRVMTDHSVRAKIDGKTSLGAVFGRRIAQIRDAPMKNDHDAVRAVPQRANVCFERFRRIHGAAGFVRSRGRAAIPVVTEKTNAPAACLTDDGPMRFLLIDAGAQGCKPFARKDVYGL